VLLLLLLLPLLLLLLPLCGWRRPQVIQQAQGAHHRPGHAS
jgi:hypothetical protein